MVSFRNFTEFILPFFFPIEVSFRLEPVLHFENLPFCGKIGLREVVGLDLDLLEGVGALALRELVWGEEGLETNRRQVPLGPSALPSPVERSRASSSAR